MDTWIKEAILSTSQDFSSDCFKILSWLDTEYFGPLKYKHVETLLTSAAFIDSYFETSKAHLSKDLMEKYTQHRLFLKKHCKKFYGIGITLPAAATVLGTTDGYKHVNAVENILKMFTTDFSRLYEYNECNRSPNAESAQFKIQSLVDRVFRLPPKNIDIVIDRILRFLDFSLIGYIFLEPFNRLNIKKCKILEEKLCKKIAVGNINSYVIKSMFETASSSLNGQIFFKSCLGNVTFGNSLVTFLILYIQNFDKGTENLELKLPNLLYLVHCILTSKQECRLRLCSTILKNQSVSCLINKNFFIYN
ncbi:uncharacterized protein [Eurosta solidaginis]|uniref:uncharacterized protein n=1 Tax=Eurosta solidaginis TaxID=178769 RepID=UPI003530D3DC